MRVSRRRDERARLGAAPRMESRSVEPALDVVRRFRVRRSAGKGTHLHGLDPATESSHHDHRNSGAVPSQDLRHQRDLGKLACRQLRPSPAPHRPTGDSRQGRRKPPQSRSHEPLHEARARGRGRRCSSAAAAAPTLQEPARERCNGADQCRPGHLFAIASSEDPHLLVLQILDVLDQT